MRAGQMTAVASCFSPSLMNLDEIWTARAGPGVSASCWGSGSWQLGWISYPPIPAGSLQGAGPKRGPGQRGLPEPLLLQSLARPEGTTPALVHELPSLASGPSSVRWGNRRPHPQPARSSFHALSCARTLQETGVFLPGPLALCRH